MTTVKLPAIVATQAGFAEVLRDRRVSRMAPGCDVIRFMTSHMDSPRFDLADADLRVTRGSVPASAQLAGLLKAQILERQLPPGSRLPTERELIERSGLSRVTVRAAVGILEGEGWVVRRQGLGTFVAEPVKQELESGVRTITEVLVSRGVTPRVEVLSHEVIPAPEPVGATASTSRPASWASTTSAWPGRKSWWPKTSRSAVWLGLLITIQQSAWFGGRREAS